MTYLGNSPEEQTILRLQARKSFQLALWMEDKNGNPLDIASSTLRMVVRKKNFPSSTSSDADNLIVNSTAEIVTPALGYARFNLQASELDEAPGEYAYSIVLSEGGYTSTIVQGVLEIIQNTEFTSTTESYMPGDQISTSLRVAMREQGVLYVKTGPILAPGQATFTHMMEDMLNQIFAGAVAAGQTLTADQIADGINKVIMTIAERAKLASLTKDYTQLDNLPTFGDIVTHNASDFLTPTHVNAATDVTSGVLNNARVPTVINLRGISRGTAAPSGGSDGDLYIKYT
jgi:hypothetical protein